MQQATIYKLEMQIKAINSVISSGKCKNEYAAKGKIKQLEKKLKTLKFNNFLSQ